MKHLNDEERLAFMEGRASKENSDHVAECAQCAAEIRSMRRTIKRLEHFEWPVRAPRGAGFEAPIFKLAMAAGIVLCVGFGLGRFTGPNAAEIKAEITRELQPQLAALRAQSKPEIDANTVLAMLTELRD